MRLTVVLAALALSFVAPVFVTTAEAAQPGTVRASSLDASCKGRRAKKSQDDGKSKKKDPKKPYGFEL
jgi:hypothetical protein